MKNRKKPVGIWTDVAVLVVCLAIVTSCLSSGMLAKYASRASGGFDSARAAAFNVNAVLQSSDDTIDDTPAVYKLDLTNDSEVAVRYTVFIDFNGKADGLEVIINGVSRKIVAGSEAIFENVGTLDPGASADDLTVTIKRGDFEGAADDLSFTAKVKFVQVD